MKYLIFSDLDGTFLNRNTYSTGNLKTFIKKLDIQFEIIFASSKTYEEIVRIMDLLEINFPFIVENGACIFFPKNYLDKKKINRYLFKYKNHLGLKITKFDSEKIITITEYLKKKYRFSFYNDLSDNKIMKITNLKKNEVILSKSRKFSNPLFWEDSEKKKISFIKEITSSNHRVSVLDGGRFLHILDNFDKGVAVKRFLKIKNTLDDKYITISLGDSENDIPLLELTDFACIIKSENSEKIILNNRNAYRSKFVAPKGWSESLEYFLRRS